MSDTTVKITIDDKQALGELDKLGRKFSDVGDKAETSMGSVGAASAKSAGSVKLLGDQINNTVKSLIAFSFAKKLFATADAANKAAGEMRGLSASARDSSDAYNALTKSTGDSLNKILISTTGFLSTLAEYAAEGTEYWSTILGGDTEADKKARDNNIANLNFANARARVAANDLKEVQKKLNGDLTEYQREFYQKSIKVLQFRFDNETRIAKEYAEKVKDLSDGIEKERTRKTDSEIKAEETKILAAQEKALADQKAANQKKIDEDNAFWNKLDDDANAYWENRAKEEREAAIKLGDLNVSIAEKNQERIRAAVENGLELRELEIQAALNLADRHREIQKSSADYELMLYKDMKDTELEYAKRNEAFELESRAAIYGASASLFGALSELASVGSAKNRELALLAMDLAQAQAVANTLEGITKAYAQGGVAGLITGSAVGISGFAQVAKIEQEKQKLWNAGLVEGPQSGDQVEIRANGGEIMLDRSMQMNLVGILRNGAQTGAGITYAPVINAGNKDNIKQMLRDNASEFESFIVTTLNKPSSQRAGKFV